MVTGQVGFHDRKKLKYVTVEKRDNAIVNRLNKTKVEKPTEVIPELRAKRDQAERRKRKKALQEAVSFVVIWHDRLMSMQSHLYAK